MQLEEALNVILQLDTSGIFPCEICIKEENDWCEEHCRFGDMPDIECYKKYLWIKVREKIREENRLRNETLENRGDVYE